MPDAQTYIDKELKSGLPEDQHYTRLATADEAKTMLMGD